MRNGEEHEVARIESRVVMGGEGEVGGAGEAGVFARDGRAGQLVRGDSDELEVGMAQGDPRQLDAGEPRRAYDARRDRHVDRLRSARHVGQLVSCRRFARFVQAHKSKPFAPLSIILRKKRRFDKVRSENSRARSKGDAARGGEKGAPEGEGPWRVRTTAMGTCRRAAMRSASGPRFCRACAGREAPPSPETRARRQRIRTFGADRGKEPCGMAGRHPFSRRLDTDPLPRSIPSDRDR